MTGAEFNRLTADLLQRPGARSAEEILRYFYERLVLESERPPELNGRGLSPRKIACLRLVARGFSNKRISQELAVDVGTIKAHVWQIFRLTGCRNRLELALWARDHAGWLEKQDPLGLGNQRGPKAYYEEKATRLSGR